MKTRRSHSLILSKLALEVSAATVIEMKEQLTNFNKPKTRVLMVILYLGHSIQLVGLYYLTLVTHKGVVFS